MKASPTSRIAGLFNRVQYDCKKYLKVGEHSDTLHLAIDRNSLSHQFKHNTLYQ